MFAALVGNGGFGWRGNGELRQITGAGVLQTLAGMVGSGVVASFGQVQASGVLEPALVMAGDGVVALFTGTGSVVGDGGIVGSGVIPPVVQSQAEAGGLVLLVGRGRFDGYILRFAR